jgi:hypothetical protein
MKKQINPTIKAHLIRGAFYLLLVSGGTVLAFFRPEALAKISKRTLTFVERVGYQRAIEEVYWQHRIWPAANDGPKPSLDKVMSQAADREESRRLSGQLSGAGGLLAAADYY